MNKPVYMLLYALLSGLSLFNLYAQIPHIWNQPHENVSPFTATLIKYGLVAWILFSTVVVLAVCAKWMP